MDISEDEVSHFLEKESCSDGITLDFLKLCTKILTTKRALDHIAPEINHTPTNANRKINSRTFTRRKGSGHTQNAMNRGRKSVEQAEFQDHRSSLKGCIFDTESLNILCGHRYQFEITENSPVEIVAQAIDNKGCFTPMPAVEVMLFLENDEPNKKLVTFSSSISLEGYCSIKMNLKRGKYLLVPVTVNWKGKFQEPEMSEMEPLTDFNEDGEIVLTASCQKALKMIFDLIDLDRNSLLSQLEFDLFIQHICGETACDEWTTVIDNFDTVNGELTFDGFLSLYKMAVVTDSQDVAHMFKKMGLSNSFELQETLPFLLTVNAKVALPNLQPLAICIFDSLMEEVFRKTAIEQGYCTKIRNMNDLLLYTHKLPHRVTIVIYNQSHSKTKVRLDCSNSENCISHRNSLDYTVEVQPGTSLIGHHLSPERCGEAWSIHCLESLVE